MQHRGRRGASGKYKRAQRFEARSIFINVLFQRKKRFLVQGGNSILGRIFARGQRESGADREQVILNALEHFIQSSRQSVAADGPQYGVEFVNGPIRLNPR